MAQVNFPTYGTITVSLATVYDLEDFSPLHITEGMHAIVTGQTSVDDGLGGIFTWVGSSTTPADGLYVIASPSLSTGRWIKSVRGPKGDVGPIGPQSLFSGTINPVDTIGVSGNFYINTATNTLFGPKTSTWPIGTTLATKALTNTAPVGYEPSVGFFDSAGTIRSVPARAARGWIDPREMTNWVSETNDHTASVQAALTASRLTGVPVSVGGNLTLTLAGASLDCAGATVRSAQQPYTRNTADPMNAGGLTLIHNGPNPMFQPSAGGFSLEGITYYDQQQPGTGAAPVNRPPVFRIAAGTQITDWSLTNCVIVNAFDTLELMPASGSVAAALIGDARIVNNRIFSVRHDFNLKGISPEVIFVEGNIFSPGVNQNQAVFGNGGMLAKWKAKNGCHILVDTGTATVDGWSSLNNYIFNCRRAIYLVSGGMTVCKFTGDNFDQVATILETSGASVADLIIMGGSAYSNTYGDTSVVTDAMIFAGTKIHQVTIAIQVGKTTGAWINAMNTLPSGSNANRIIDRSTVFNTGGSVSIVNNAPTGVLQALGSYDK